MLNKLLHARLRHAKLVLGVMLCALTACSQNKGQTNQRQATDTEGTTRSHAESHGDLVQELAFVATTFHISTVAELAQPYPTGLSIPAGAHTLDDVMKLLVHGAPAYAWQDRSGVIWVYNKRLVGSAGDFLNVRLANFTMPRRLGELKLTLPLHIGSAQGKGGGLLTGMTSPDAGSPDLAQEVLKGVSAREVVLRAGQQAKLFSLFVFPNDSPKTQAELQDAWSNWTLVTTESLLDRPLFAKSLPAKKLPDIQPPSRQKSKNR